MEKDCYKVLGLERSATEVEIKRAFHKLALRYHPDHNNGDCRSAERFKEINAAYKVLRDRDSRARYDWANSSSASMTVGFWAAIFR